MKFLFTIALFALIGCAGNKPAKTLPTCEEFYDFYKNFAKRISKVSETPGIEADTIFFESLKFLEMPLEQHSCNDTITCDGKTYCVSAMP